MQSKHVGVDGIDIAVVEAGKGIPLLLVHGFPFDHTMWQAQIEGLSHRCRVLAPDLPGFGASGLAGRSVSMEQFADYLAKLLDELGVDGRVVLCGLSMGGYIAWQFWARHPQRLRALVLCDTRAAADTPEMAAVRQQTAEQVLRDGAAVLAEGMIAKLLAPATLRKHPDIVERVRRMILGAGREAAAAALRGMAARPDMTGRLRQIDYPTLVLVGEHDAISPPEEMRRIAQAIPAAQFVTIPGAGHLAPLENPQAVNEAIDRFLSQVEAG